MRLAAARRLVPRGEMSERKFCSASRTRSRARAIKTEYLLRSAPARRLPFVFTSAGEEGISGEFHLLHTGECVCVRERGRAGGRSHCKHK